MTKRIEFIEKFKAVNKRHLDMLERHKQVIDKYAIPYPAPGRDNWGLRYEKIMARKKQKENFGKKNVTLDKDKIEVAKKTVSTTSSIFEGNILDAGNESATDKPVLMGAWAYFKFLDY